MTSSEGPSRAGPISERVVKPEALGILLVDALGKEKNKCTLDQDQQHKRLVLALTKTPICWICFWPPL